KLQAQGGFTPVPKKAGHVGHPRLYNGLIGTATTIWKGEGLRGMYRGLGPIVMGYLPTWAVWFTVYNKAKGAIRPHYSMFPVLPALHSFSLRLWPVPANPLLTFPSR
ncbi:hypothetical protein IMZ48_08615, partial [Candidatus Bathyarchaeota archaeon]|nr:hypothetical protein [Candidatus Bathyarchaeota archaeon]